MGDLREANGVELRGFAQEPTQEGYNAIAKAQAEIFAAELRDLYTRYQYSTVGDMERSGMLTAGADIESAIAKLELLKSAL